VNAPVHTGPIIEQSPDSVALAHIEAPVPPSRTIEAMRPQQLVAQILDLAAKGMAIADLRELAAMEKDISARQAVQDFNEALAAFKRECPTIKKNRASDVATRSGAGFNLNWADLSEIQRTVDPILAKHGLSYSWDSEADGKGLMKTTCTLRHVNGHSVPSSLSLPTENAAAMSPQQKYGSAMTFAQRRTLSNVLGVVIEDDHPDTNEVDPTPVTDDQATHIDDLLRELGGNAKPRFLKHFEIAKVVDLKAVDYERAVSMLEDIKTKRAEKKS
jgi:hypothetical protein